MMDGWGSMWGWGMGFGWIVVLALAALIGWLIANAGRQTPAVPAERPGQPLSELSALEILERRYASGELSDEQFERMRQHLQRSAGGSTTQTPGEQE